MLETMETVNRISVLLNDLEQEKNSRTYGIGDTERMNNTEKQINIIYRLQKG